ncbi:MAG: 6-phosphogluconate dehydrogenase [Bacteroidetes bacterium]|nr:6-phosphogluconate dehydrogenase [Bacteroidota bacterium]
MDNVNTPAPKPKRKMRKILVIVSLTIVAIWFIYYFICGMTYSKGTRSGILTKVSEKGFVFKTYEGEMNVGGFSQDGGGTLMPASIFKFSVPNKKTYDQLEQLQGDRVVLHYRQVMKNFFWQGDTDYFIYEVSRVK